MTVYGRRRSQRILVVNTDTPVDRWTYKSAKSIATARTADRTALISAAQ